MKSTGTTEVRTDLATWISQFGCESPLDLPSHLPTRRYHFIERDSVLLQSAQRHLDPELLDLSSEDFHMRVARDRLQSALQCPVRKGPQ